MNDLTDNRIHNFRSLYQFCVEAITTCLSFNADKACVPFALFALSALLLFTSCVVLIHQRCTVRQGNTGAVVAIYCFLGNLCSTIGAVLSQQLDIQDNTQVLGYTLGMISLAIVCTSRFPAINRACRREKVSPAAGVSAVLCSSTGLLYISALLLSDPVVPGLFLKAAPWLLSALCGATLDLLVLVIFWCRKGARRKPERISLDTQSLLEFPHFHKRHGNQLKKHRKQEKNNSKTPKTAEIGHYMDVSVQPAVKECREDLMLSGRDNLATGTTRGVQLVQVASGGSVCSSCTSYDSSSYSSDLEWDFEEARSCWSEPPWRTEEGDEFLQDWPKNPPPFVASTCSASDFTEMPL
ncbi:transmembrane protein 44 isoform X4 [Gadus macrocephalus]|uniref:transmembrane protein 44 isoform X4 n=1 Tax=Gadus macrocephalus TaxID=80720 RepID=UPI0028CB687C|nr:transmembrane protein 44 isoform X4 [Gadus macrocephalus]